jgi:import receptor subunit TOM20
VKEHKKQQKSSKQQQETGRAQVVAALKRALALVNSETGTFVSCRLGDRGTKTQLLNPLPVLTVPQDVESKEQFFMEQVALGEQLAARCTFFSTALSKVSREAPS